MVSYKATIILNNSSSVRTTTGRGNEIAITLFKEKDGKIAPGISVYAVVKSAPQGATPGKNARFSAKTDTKGEATFGNVIFDKAGDYMFTVYAPSIRDDSDNRLVSKTFKVESKAEEEEAPRPKEEGPPAKGGTIPPVTADESIGEPGRGGTQTTITTPSGYVQTFDITALEAEIRAETQKALEEAQKAIDEARVQSEAATMTFLDELLAKGKTLFGDISDTLFGDIGANLESAQAVFDSIATGGLALIASMMDGLNKLFNPSLEDLINYQINIIKAQAEAGARLGVRSTQ